MTYKLPLKEDGMVDLARIAMDIRGTIDPYSSKNAAYLQALVAHVRSLEREACKMECVSILDKHNFTMTQTRRIPYIATAESLLTDCINTISARGTGEHDK